MILITGGAGKTGQAIMQALLKQGAALRAFVYREAAKPKFEAMAAVEIVVGDMRDLEAFRQATHGVEAIYHLAPNMSPDEVLMGQNLIAAAKAEGVARVVYHSVLHPQLEAMPHHWAKMQVEAMLIEAGLGITILQPAAYMQNILAQRESILSDGRFDTPYPTTTRISLIDLHDLAEAAAIILTESGHIGATYELVGTPPTSQDEMASLLSQHLGREVAAGEIALNVWEDQARQAGLSEYATKTLLAMFSHYTRHDFIGNPNTLGWLLGRPPTSLEMFIKREFGLISGIQD